METKTIFVTGATGFVGSNLVHRLVKDGHEVHVSARKESNLWRLQDIKNDLIFHYSDITDRYNIEKTVSEINPDIVYHTAVYGGYPFQSDDDKIIKTNLIGTINVLKACLKTDMQCFVNTGTSSEYGMKSAPIKETDFLDPASSYAFSKAAATLYCHMAAKSVSAPVVTLRPFSPYGYYEEPGRLVPYVIRSCLRNEQPKLSSKTSVRDFIFIDDLIEAYILAAETQPAHGEIFNIGCGKQHTITDVVDKTKVITESSVEPVWESASGRPNEPAVWVADIAKARNVLGWEPEYSLDDGLKKTVEWVRNNMEFYL